MGYFHGELQLPPAHISVPAFRYHSYRQNQIIMAQLLLSMKMYPLNGIILPCKDNKIAEAWQAEHTSVAEPVEVARSSRPIVRELEYFIALFSLPLPEAP